MLGLGNGGGQITAVFASGGDHTTSHAHWGYYMIAAVAIQILTGFMRVKGLEAKHANFSFLHRVSVLLGRSTPWWNTSPVPFFVLHPSPPMRCVLRFVPTSLVFVGVLVSWLLSIAMSLVAALLASVASVVVLLRCL